MAGAVRAVGLSVALVLGVLAGGCGDDPPPASARPQKTTAGDRFFKVDTHTHFGPAAAGRMVALMDRYGIDVVVNLSGRSPGRGLEAQLAAARAHPGRIVVFCNLDWRLALTGPGYGARMAAQVEAAHALGARGLKIFKGLGLGYRDYRGRLIPVDDPELDRVFETAGRLGMPVAIHTGDPVAFWQPPGPQNERRAELSVHPQWSLYGKDVPSWEDLFAQLSRRIARHPHTTFISVHFGNAPEYPERVRHILATYPNVYIDTAARIPEIGRQPPAVIRKLFVDFQDRILFGTDLGVPARGALSLGSSGASPPDRAEIDRFFASTWRYFETADQNFAHPTPIQGDWTIDAIDLPDAVLRKVYGDNARRLFGLSQPRR